MKHLTIFSAALCLAFLMGSPIRAVQNPTATPAPATVEGVVVTAADGKPMAEVLVSIQSEPGEIGHFATTDGNGRFRIEGLSPGEYFLSVSKRGFVQAAHPPGPADSPDADNLVLESGERRNNLRVRMEAAAAVFGRVLDEKRRPRSSTIQLLKYEYQGEYRLLSPVYDAKAETDDRGEYRLFFLKPGEYFLRAIPGRRATGAQKLQPPVYYPGVTDPQQATPVRLTSGADIGGIDLAVADRPSYSARFKVAGVVPGTVSLMIEYARRGDPILKEGSRCTNTGPDTRTCSGLIPGTYDIRVRTLSSLSDDGLYGRITVEIIDRDIDAPDLVLYPPVHIQGRIVIPENLSRRIAARDLKVFAENPPNVHAFFSPQSSDVAPDGTFTIDAAEGRYSTAIQNLPADLFIESVRYDGQDVTDSGLPVARTANATLELSISGSSGSVEGVVRTTTGEAVAFSTVSLVPRSDRRNNFRAYRTGVTNDAGAFRIEGVPAGEYSVLAWKDIVPGAEVNRAFVERFELRAQRMNVEAGKAKTINLTVVPADR